MKTDTLPKPLQTTLQRVKLRLRWQQSGRWLLPVLSIGLLLTLLLTLSGRLYPLAMPLLLLTIGLSITLIILLITLLYIWLRPHSPQHIARLLDRRLKLDERLSTTLELTTNNKHNTPSHIIKSQLTDSLNCMQNLDLKDTAPLRLSWPWLTLTLIFIIALVINLLIPNQQVQILEQQHLTEEIIGQQLTRFEELQADLLADETFLETAPGQELQQTLAELIDTLQQENLNLEEAMAAISAAEQELAKLEDAANQQESTLNDLAETFSQFDSTADLAEALEQRNIAQAAESLASAGNDATTNPEQAQDLIEALQQAAQVAAAAGETELAESLNQAAEALEQALAQSGESGNGDGDSQAAQEALQQALQQAAEELNQAGQQFTDQEAVQQALANIQQARQQLAEAAGQQLGQGQQSGQGAAQSGPNVGGAGREDPGLADDGLFSVEPAPDRMDTDNGPNEGRIEDYESLYAPDHLGGEGGPIVNPDSPDSEGGVPIGDAPVDPNQDPGTALVPYNEVYGQYTDAAGQALEDSYIPLGMKGYVRQYFGALEPEGN